MIYSVVFAALKMSYRRRAAFHCGFSTKERVPILNPEVRERLRPYLAFLRAHEVEFDE